MTIPWSKSIRVQIELTTACNLRCVYCAVSDPGYKGESMSVEVFTKIVDMCRKANVQLVNVSGHGETFNLPDWRDKIRLLLQDGFKLQSSTNAAVPWSWEDAELLSQFVQIMVSVDTVDPEKLRRLRRKVDLRTIIHNIVLVRTVAISQGRPPPRIDLACVLNDQSIRDLDRLVALAKALDCQINLSNLIELHGLTDTPPVSVFSLEGPALVDAWRHYRKAADLADHLGVGFNMHPNLKDFLDRLPANGFANSAVTADWKANYRGADQTRYRACTDLLAQGEVRDCLDPWTMLYFGIDGTVHQCCTSPFNPIGHVAEVDSIDDLFGSERSDAFRRGLWEGRPVGACLNCIGRRSCAAQDLRARVSTAVG